jgi:hypothetical protein
MRWPARCLPARSGKLCTRRTQRIAGASSTWSGTAHHTTPVRFGCFRFDRVGGRATTVVTVVTVVEARHQPAGQPYPGGDGKTEKGSTITSETYMVMVRRKQMKEKEKTKKQATNGIWGNPAAVAVVCERRSRPATLSFCGITIHPCMYNFFFFLLLLFLFFHAAA